MQFFNATKLYDTNIGSLIAAPCSYSYSLQLLFHPSVWKQIFICKLIFKYEFYEYIEKYTIILTTS